MEEHSNKFYVTTPIYYGTAKPHLGSLYSTLLADVATRWHKMLGNRTYFLTGTDEHGQKILQAAQKAGMEPQAFVDSFVHDYKTTWQHYEFVYDQFIRTTDPEHKKAVQEWVKTAQKKGDIYKSVYSGWYCTPCETYVTETQAGPHDKAPLCASCNRETSYVSEESYFFKLSAYQEKLLQFYKENPNFIVPKERLNEVIRFVEAGLKDLSISRTTISWGVPFPEDTSHVVYVWVDALLNYISAIGYGQHGMEENFKKWWPADLQILGKDIIRFHAVFWPAFLMAADLPLPKKLLVHGWIKVDKQKMSKSLGNVVDPMALYEEYGADAVRFYLVRHIAITHDSEFSIADLQNCITSDLANDLGNLLNRMLTLALKHDLSQVPKHTVWNEMGVDLRNACWDVIEEYKNYMNDGMFHMAVARLWKFINQVNAYFHANEPWKLAKNAPVQFTEVISATCHSLYTIGLLLWPVMPKKMEELLRNLGVDFHVKGNMVELLASNRWDHQFYLQVTETLFAKPEKVEKMEPTEKVITPEQAYITIDQLTPIELRVGTIEACDHVEKSDKLYKLSVNFGAYGVRQILSGVKQAFKQEELVGKQAIFVYNLQPRKMVGLESQGMMLMAKDEKGLRLIVPEHAVENGTKLS
ncbi:MAG: methionine--tRNA ligase [Candidatus Babeliales bacterium]